MKIGILGLRLGHGRRGRIDASHYLEAMCLVWVDYAIRNKTWNHAFKLLKK